MATHPRTELNPDFANPLRFSLMALLSKVEKMPFKEARAFLDTSDSQLSKHASALADAGYVKIHKSFTGKTPVTAYSATSAGVKAWEAHLGALRSIVEGG